MNTAVQSDKKRNYRPLCLLLGGIILANPVVGFIDFLPNFFGYLLISLGLCRVSDLDGHLSEAYKRFRILAILGLGQIVMSYFGYGVLRSEATNLYEMRSYVVLCSFVMLTVHLFYLLPAFRELFLGVEYLAHRQDAAEIVRPNKRGKTPLGRLWSKTRFFVFFSAVMAFLPEISALTSLTGMGPNGIPVFGEKWYGDLITPEAFDWYRFISLLRFLSGIAVLIAGGIWGISLLRFFKKLKREGEWLARLGKKYQVEVLPQTDMLTVRRFSMAFYPPIYYKFTA